MGTSRKTFDEVFARQLGARLKEIFGGTSNRIVSERLGGLVSGRAIWSYVHGLSIPSHDVLLRISEVYQVSLDWLLKGQESLIPRDSVEADIIGSIRRNPGIADTVAAYAHFVSDGTLAAGKDDDRQRVWKMLFKTHGLDAPGKRLRYLREVELKLGTKEFAAELNISVVELERLEVGKEHFRAAVLTIYLSRYNDILPLDLLLAQ